MRWVTRKPPTTLIVAKTTARKPRTGGQRLEVPATSRRPDERDAGDGVRARHQGGVQGGRHLVDDLEADEGGQHEDGELGDRGPSGGLRCAAGSGQGFETQTLADLFVNDLAVAGDQGVARDLVVEVQVQGLPDLSVRWPRKVAILRAYIRLASWATGARAGWWGRGW